MNPIKKIITACFLMLCIYSHAQVVPPLTIKVETAGTLSSLIPLSEKYQITNLTLTGFLNGTDIRFIREMAGKDVQGVGTTGKLSILDLSGANIVAGGSNYYMGNNSSLNTIGNSTFGRCEGLTSVTLPNSVTTIEDAAFAFCSGLKQLNIGKNVTTIGVSAFSNCSRLASLTLPNSLTFIGSEAFIGCRALTSLLIPDNVTKIHSWAFYGCEGLTSVTLPNSVTTIGDAAFSGCAKLTEIFCKASVPPRATSGTFLPFSYANCKLYVPKGTLNDYWLAICWGDFKNIIEEVTTSISDLESSKINIYSENGSIIVKGGKLGDIIDIYSVSGLLLHKIRITDDIVRINASPQSFYIVKTGNKTFKIALL